MEPTPRYQTYPHPVLSFVLVFLVFGLQSEGGIRQRSSGLCCTAAWSRRKRVSTECCREACRMFTIKSAISVFHLSRLVPRTFSEHFADANYTTQVITIVFVSTRITGVINQAISKVGNNRMEVLHHYGNIRNEVEFQISNTTTKLKLPARTPEVGSARGTPFFLSIHSATSPPSPLSC